MALLQSHIAAPIQTATGIPAGEDPFDLTSGCVLALVEVEPLLRNILNMTVAAKEIQTIQHLPQPARKFRTFVAVSKSWHQEINNSMEWTKSW